MPAVDPDVEVCLSKKPIRFEDKARRLAELMTKLFGVPMDYYKCDVCYQFHLTSRDGSVGDGDNEER